jgi:mannose-6-phosphate isomerase class I
MRAISLRPDNLIARPWGGFKLAVFKGVAGERAAERFGESFEVSACPEDAEAGAHPSVAVLDDGTEVPLPDLLRRSARAILGDALAAQSGGTLPLLPKFLDVQSLLSIQAHPPGNPECYIVLDADPGASIRVGFRQSMDAREIVARCRAGRAAQERVATLLAGTADAAALQSRLEPALADRNRDVEGCLAALEDVLPRGGARQEVAALLSEIFSIYWLMLDAMHDIPVAPGQVIFNVTPERLRRQRVCSAEVHALGNPARREILLLEVRKPGTTYRLWDNARFPLRPLQIEEAVGALNLEATSAGEFVFGNLEDSTAGEARTLVTCPDFVVDHLRVEGAIEARHDTGGCPVTLHGIAGAVTLHGHAGDLGGVGRGESLLVPASVGAYVVRSTGSQADVVAVRVTGTGLG